ncbi:hypothetical protein [Paenibacillus massiliensis]|nr:hypothetical protein [Paenibacillus massiliensis]
MKRRHYEPYELLCFQLIAKLVRRKMDEFAAEEEVNNGQEILLVKEKEL